MAFESVELNYADLPIETQYRFAEIEMRYALDALAPLFPAKYGQRDKLITVILDAIQKHQELTQEEKSAFFDSTVTYTFMQPSKDELVHYFRFKNTAYNRITRITGISPNTIAAKRFDYSTRFPVWHFWTPKLLLAWNEAKKPINLFNETLIHTKK